MRRSRSTTNTSGDPLAELRAIYTEIDAALSGFTCETSTDCCRFGVTGREPYPTAVELAEMDRAVRARGGLPKRRSLPLATERRCTLLDDRGRCLIYASRPFGCRTFFCSRAVGPVGERAPSHLPKALISGLSRRIAELSSQWAPTDPGPRPLSRAAARWDRR